MAEVIDGYDRVLDGELSGIAYLFDLIDTYRLTNDEILYLAYMAADIIERRPVVEMAAAKCRSG